MYSYVIEVAGSESDLGLHDKALLFKIVAFYHLLENALDRPGRRGHEHLGNSRKNFENFEGFDGFLRVFESIFTKLNLCCANEVDTRN